LTDIYLPPVFAWCHSSAPAVDRH